MHSLSILLPFLAPILLTSASPVPEVVGGLDVAPDSLPKFSSVQYSGSGCPSSAPGVVRTGAFADPAFRLNGFEAKVPDGTSSVNCQVHIEASGASAGWQVGLDSVSVRGHLVLDPGATLDWFVTSFFSQDADRTVSSTFLFSICVLIPPMWHIALVYVAVHDPGAVDVREPGGHVGRVPPDVALLEPPAAKRGRVR